MAKARLSLDQRPVAHFLRVGKTAGIAVTWRRVVLQIWQNRLVLHPHRDYFLRCIPETDYFFFCVRNRSTAMSVAFFIDSWRVDRIFLSRGSRRKSRPLRNFRHLMLWPFR